MNRENEIKIQTVDDDELVTKGYLRSELSVFKTEFSTELRAEMTDLKVELRTEMKDLKTELIEVMQEMVVGLSNDMKTGFSYIHGRMDEMNDKLQITMEHLSATNSRIDQKADREEFHELRRDFNFSRV